MAPKSERRQAQDALEQAFLVNIIAQLEARALELNEDHAGADDARLDEDTNMFSTEAVAPVHEELKNYPQVKVREVEA
ncbi:hypothetical protein FISHEDRAFT_78597 [Fistulina hepatica ATCC 64428]|uniref:Uncharacterized protein n=1 Tax=Fistulina hepatica ATCC 64428 TaxID=1128425 RepID=A0A0D7A325_9AGAR|nr:hypothetical protein FISHEDRAFT_78597 [Fistulina hepatica ATCC 64428]